MSSYDYLLIEDGKVKDSFATEEEAIDAMNEEHKRDVLAMLCKRRLVNLFVRGKYKLKEYVIVKAIQVKTICSDDATLGGVF